MPSFKEMNEHEKNIISFLNTICGFTETCPDIRYLYNMLYLLHDNFISFDEYKKILLKIKKDDIFFQNWLIV